MEEVHANDFELRANRAESELWDLEAAANKTEWWSDWEVGSRCVRSDPTWRFWLCLCLSQVVAVQDMQFGAPLRSIDRSIDVCKRRFCQVRKMREAEAAAKVQAAITKNRERVAQMDRDAADARLEAAKEVLHKSSLPVAKAEAR